jgi:hypothetical protein
MDIHDFPVVGIITVLAIAALFLLALLQFA